MRRKQIRLNDGEQGYIQSTQNGKKYSLFEYPVDKN
jgi:hypothetical protein